MPIVIGSYRPSRGSITPRKARAIAKAALDRARGAGYPTSLQADRVWQEARQVAHLQSMNGVVDLWLKTAATLAQIADRARC
jgi:hypothetical protein